MEISGKERGGALILALIISAFLGFLVSQIFFLSSSIQRSRTRELHAARAKIEAKSALIKEVKYTAIFLECKPYTAKRGLTTNSKTLCVVQTETAPDMLLSPALNGLTSEPKLFPQFSFNSLLSMPTPCRLEPLHSFTHSTHGFKFTLTSNLSGRTCYELSSPHNQVAISGNLDIIEPTLFDVETVMTVSGYTDLRVVNVTATTLILAGGDLHIGKLHSFSESPLTLISTSGVVAVDELLGLAKLRVIAYAGIYLPSGLVPLGNSEVLPILPLSVLGFERTN